MKTLQNDFTTPEQSERLLELGVPSWTADCCFDTNTNPFVRIGHDTTYYGNISPCWSVGRLIEILRICSPTDAITCEFSEKTTVWRIVRWFENDDLDFSKLEEQK